MVERLLLYFPFFIQLILTLLSLQQHIQLLVDRSLLALPKRLHLLRHMDPLVLCVRQAAPQRRLAFCQGRHTSPHQILERLMVPCVQRCPRVGITPDAVQ